MISREELEIAMGKTIDEATYERAMEIVDDIILVRETAGERTSDRALMNLIITAVTLLQSGIDIQTGESEVKDL